MPTLSLYFKVCTTDDLLRTPVFGFDATLFVLTKNSSYFQSQKFCQFKLYFELLTIYVNYENTTIS